MSFNRIAAAGAGTMGSQVAWQMAFHGKHVTVYDAIPTGLETGKAFHAPYAEHFIERRGASQRQVDDTFARLTYTADLAEAGRDADLISESVPESMSIKESFWREASGHAPGTDRVHDQHVDTDAERAGRLRRSAGQVPRPALRHRGVGFERGHGPSRQRHRGLRPRAGVRR